MDLKIKPAAEIALRALDRDDQRRVTAWFDYLRDWKTDQFVRNQSALIHVNGQDAYVLKTSSDIRIFFTVDEENDTITVLDIATREGILRAGHRLPEGSVEGS